MGSTLRRRWLLPVAGALVGAAVFAPASQAAFAPPFTDPCSGSSISGRGASFQVSAQNAWIADFRATACSSWPGDGKTITYFGTGSGSGRTAFGQNATGTREAGIRYAATDEAPTAAQTAQMEAGTTATGDEGELRVIPIASGAIPVIVNYPDNCTIPSGAQWRADATNNTTRVIIANGRIERVFAGEAAFDTWGELVPGLQGTNGKTDADCQSQPVRRVVRLDSSGTTFAFKQWLKSINPARTWEEPTLGNTAWPNDTGNVAVLRGVANGNGSLADRVNATDGSLGYGDLAIARTKGFDMSNCPNPCASPDTTFWLAVTNTGSPPRRTEPTVSPLGYKVGGAKGSNCRATQYQNIPAQADATLGNWFDVTGIASPTGFPICTLTYELAWDDNRDVYGDTPTEEAAARSVKDYLTYAIGVVGQNQLQANDYAPVPDDILNDIARPGVQAIDWDK